MWLQIKRFNKKSFVDLFYFIFGNGVNLRALCICMTDGIQVRDLFLEFTSWWVADRFDVVYIGNNIFLLNRICDSEFKSRKGNDSNGFLEVEFSSSRLAGKK